ncbi:sodium-dependent noradrenaline transporter-like isoform X2 [Zootermopsis nevadensis]|uniref:sodium-dependent noradrenaline transporter-like isoform X2 n=1 Tax=Zootermopsis nevadensis TaxID=136037 RepID=UPI000B8EBCD3|nr:sodium-dependent noradrenaline transporter-like isoform X2 [Zootermopsis nevadensis]
MELALYRSAQQQEGCSGAVVQNNPAEDTNTTSSMTTMTSCLQQQNIVLDDGYGSSNSSPHSSEDLQVQLEEGEKGYEALVVPSGSPCAVDGGAATSRDGRETWGRGADFLLSIIGFAVDLANVWRFPYLCYRNGGGAFLIPYTLMMVFGAVPLFYMELILGQYNRQGPISVWRICPLFKGVGFCAVLVAFYVSFYYNVIIGWALYFLVASATPDLPWLHCNNTWNTDWCTESQLNGTGDISNNGSANISVDAPSPSVGSVAAGGGAGKLYFSPASEYFHRAVLEMQRSGGLHEMGYPKWQLVLCLLLVYSMLYLSLFKGVKSSGKVVWATATLPYVVLTILLIRGLMLPGAIGGIVYYLKPELGRLADTQVWVDAAVQIFYSVGAGFGVHLSYASYNTFHNNCLRDCLVTTAVNCFTSFFSGFVIFTYLGFMSHKQGIHISNVATEGPGLVFQVYPEAVATLPGSNFWSMLFFFMLIMLGLDSAMGGMECVITGLMDEFHSFFQGRRFAREIFTLAAAVVSFSIALINVTPGGIYMFHLFDTYSAGISLLCSALFEAIAVSWFYGLERFSQDVEDMLGTKPGLYWRICWKFVSPAFIIGVVMFGLLYQQPLKYNEYNYPSWAEWIGWTLALSSILMIPLVAIISIIQTPGTLKERIAINITPLEEHESIRQTHNVSRFRCKHWLYV